jgi:hypothetical protein
MRDSASIQVKGNANEVRFEWRDFDGDDCFGDFHIEVIGPNGTNRFDFGASAVYGLRKLTKFFQDASLASVSGGCRHPDLRYWDVVRADGGYRLIVRFEMTSVCEEFYIQSSSVRIDDEFLKAY